MKRTVLYPLFAIVILFATLSVAAEASTSALPTPSTAGGCAWSYTINNIASSVTVNVSVSGWWWRSRIDWGDGQEESRPGEWGTRTASHMYVGAGEYLLSLSCLDGWGNRITPVPPSIVLSMGGMKPLLPPIAPPTPLPPMPTIPSP